MTSAIEVGRALDKAPDKPTRTLYFSALLAREAGGSDLLVVGGSAIEIYTQGSYTSDDIDVIGRRRILAPILAAWGFKKSGRVWYHEGWRLVVDIPSAEYHGSLDRAQIVSTPYGPIRLAALEDLIVSRLVSAKYWQREDDFGHALLLGVSNETRIDWDYASEHARRESVGDLYAELRNRIAARRQPAPRRGRPLRGKSNRG